MATALAQSAAPPTADDPRQELEEIYRHLCERDPKSRVEIIADRVVVSPLPTWSHELVIFRLIKLLMAVVGERDWSLSGNISLFLGAQRDRYKPDLTVAPEDPPMWGDDHIHGDATVLVVEVVSGSSAADDHNVKPKGYAGAGVPLCMVIDSFAGTVLLLSKPNAQTERYELRHEVPIGKAIELPEPWNLTLETGKLVD
jgi:Uma2 family endonuclease